MKWISTSIARTQRLRNMHNEEERNAGVGAPTFECSHQYPKALMFVQSWQAETGVAVRKKDAFEG